MAEAKLFPTRRLRATPFTPRVEAAGVSGYTVYNHMLLPTVFKSLEEDYAHLKQYAQIWDVSAERQVQIEGPG
ncbi:MAG: dimethylsulfoniopropionate demethylase, partial [Amylibacter sp.]